MAPTYTPNFSFNDSYEFDNEEPISDPKPILSTAIYNSIEHFTLLPKIQKVDGYSFGVCIRWLTLAVKFTKGKKTVYHDICCDSELSPDKIYAQLQEKREEMFIDWYTQIITSIERRVTLCERDYGHTFNDKLNVIPSIAHKLRKQNFTVQVYETETSETTIIINW